MKKDGLRVALWPPSPSSLYLCPYLLHLHSHSLVPLFIYLCFYLRLFFLLLSDVVSVAPLDGPRVV